MRLLRMTPGHGDLLLAEGDPELAEDAERLVEEFRRQLDPAAVRRDLERLQAERAGGDPVRVEAAR